MSGQASQEGLAVIILVLLVISAFLMVTGSQEQSAADLKEKGDSIRACHQFAGDVQGVFLLGDGAASTIQVESATEVRGELVVVGDVVCRICCNVTNGTAQSFLVPAGTVKLTNAGGTIRIQ